MRVNFVDWLLCKSLGHSLQSPMEYVTLHMLAFGQYPRIRPRFTRCRYCGREARTEAEQRAWDQDLAGWRRKVDDRATVAS